jgi:regulator of sigma E protease
MIITLIIFVIILGLLVFVHESGHFFIAKSSGMKVEEFGFGFPPRLFGLQKSHGRWRIVWGHAGAPNPEATIYSINSIPLGGFVRILGENNEAEDDPRSFINKPFFPRLFTLLGGVLMNVVLAWVLISAAYIHGLPVAVDDLSQVPARAVLKNAATAIIDVAPGSPAAVSGLRLNDTIISVDGISAQNISGVQSYIISHKGQVFRFEIRRGNAAENISVPSLANPPPGQGPTGIALAIVGNMTFPWYLAGWEGAKTTISQMGAIVAGLYQVIVHGQGLKSLGGPIKIAQLTGQVAKLGFIHLVQFTALLSLNLAILNALPFPALDGGRVLFLFIEKIRGRRNNQKVEQAFNTAGFLLLLLLMLVISVRDVHNIGGIGVILNKLLGR